MDPGGLLAQSLIAGEHQQIQIAVAQRLAAQRPVIRTREGFRAWRIGMILANDWFNAGLCLHYSTLQPLVRPGAARQYESERPIRSPIAGPAPGERLTGNG